MAELTKVTHPFDPFMTPKAGCSFSDRCPQKNPESKNSFMAILAIGSGKSWPLYLMNPFQTRLKPKRNCCSLIMWPYGMLLPAARSRDPVMHPLQM